MGGQTFFRQLRYTAPGRVEGNEASVAFLILFVCGYDVYVVCVCGGIYALACRGVGASVLEQRLNAATGCLTL